MRREWGMGLRDLPRVIPIPRLVWRRYHVEEHEGYAALSASDRMSHSANSRVVTGGLQK